MIRKEAISNEELRKRLLEFFNEERTRSLTAWEIMRKIGLPYSSPLYFKTIKILKDLSQENIICKERNYWHTNSYQPTKEVSLKRCLNCGFEQKTPKQKEKVTRCLACGSTNMWGIKEKNL